jgi:hypothetical protein
MVMPTVKPTTQIGDEVRPMTDDEYAQWQADKLEIKTRKETQAAKFAARQAVLDKLGLTADEAAALLG